jgi:acyl-CoA synthetase (AMP-forming)/AMP-acid ligase II
MAGGAVVPINIRLAAPEIEYILADSAAELLFIDDRFAPVLDTLKGRLADVREIIHLDDGPPPAGMRAYEDLLVAPRIADAIGTDADLAGIFYTGGTTGKAKGVMLSHRNLVMNAANVVAAFGYDADSVYLHAGPMFHLADGASTLAVTVVGGVHVFVPAFDPADVLATVQREKVTHGLLVPTMINMLVNFPTFSDYDLTSLRRITYGASPMPDAVLRRAQMKSAASARQPGDDVGGLANKFLHQRRGVALTDERCGLAGLQRYQVVAPLGDCGLSHVRREPVEDRIGRQRCLMRRHLVHEPVADAARQPSAEHRAQSGVLGLVGEQPVAMGPRRS